MASIVLKDLVVDMPIFNARGRSLKHKVLGAATGGRIASNSAGQVVVRALDHISLQASRGDRIGLIGHNGSGKTTLLRVMSGAYAPTSGLALIEGELGTLIDIALGIAPKLPVAKISSCAEHCSVCDAPKYVNTSRKSSSSRISVISSTCLCELILLACIFD